MINSNAVDFSERHSKEVISFFWRSVYIPLCSAHSKNEFVFVWQNEEWSFDELLLTGMFVSWHKVVTIDHDKQG